MSTENQLRQNLYQFIATHMDQYELSRVDPTAPNGWGDRNIKNLLQHNKQVLSGLDAKQLESLSLLKTFIETNLEIMDKETMIPWKASGFIFNYENRLIVFHER